MINLDKAKKRTFEIIQIGNQTDVPSLAFDILIVFVIRLHIERVSDSAEHSDHILSDLRGAGQI